MADEIVAKQEIQHEVRQEIKTSDDLPKGVAPIKKEFLTTATDKVINWQYLPDGAADKAAEAQTQHDGEEKGEKRHRTDDRDRPDSHKKFKLRGQNKSKLRYKIGQKNCQNRGGHQNYDGERPVVNKSERLCLKFNENDGYCGYGEKCDYSHDLYKIHKLNESELFDSDKPCFIYSSYGRCQFGVACLYSKNHTIVFEEKQKAYNLIDHQKWSLANGRESFLRRHQNKLENFIQGKLRKKTYDMEIVNRAMQRLYKADLENGCVGREEREDGAEEKEDDAGEKKYNVQDNNQDKRIGAAVVDDFIGRDSRKKKIDFKGKLYLAPLTTVGNLPFRRLCKKFSCDITCAEMSLCTSLLNGNPSEWSHLRRHESEDLFGVQITASHPDHAAKIVKVLNDQCEMDFVDLNCGCPTEWIFQSGAGAGLMQRVSKLRKMIASCCMVSEVPITVKMRAGCAENKNTAHQIIRSVINPFTAEHIGAVTVHGRSRNQRYTKLADWEYINECGHELKGIPLLGSGDCISWQEYYQRLEENTYVSGVMIARGALIAPWLFTEIKERRTWDISSRERLDIVRDFVNFALDHWGSDATGIENSRKYLLEWLSFAHRYIPVGLLEVLPQRINERPPHYKGRDELETLMASPSASDWVKISEMFLGKVPDNFRFLPKHKANAYESTVEG